MWYTYDSNVTFPGNQQHAQRRICTTDNVDFCHGHHKKEKSANLLRHKKQAPFHLLAFHWFYCSFFCVLVGWLVYLFGLGFFVVSFWVVFWGFVFEVKGIRL